MELQTLLICINVVISTAALSMLIATHLLGTLSGKPFDKEIVYWNILFVGSLMTLIFTV